MTITLNLALQGPYWSLMFEVSESYLKPVNQQQVTLAGTAGEGPGLVHAGGPVRLGFRVRSLPPMHMDAIVAPPAPPAPRVLDVQQEVVVVGSQGGGVQLTLARSLAASRCPECTARTHACFLPFLTAHAPCAPLVAGTWSEVVRETLIGAINTKLVQVGGRLCSSP